MGSKTALLTGTLGSLGLGVHRDPPYIGRMCLFDLCLSDFFVAKGILHRGCLGGPGVRVCKSQ